MAFLYALSDIHGELEIFKTALQQVNLSNPDNRLFLLGDYIDYGPESGPVLRYIYKLQRIYGRKRVVALKGNHEVWLLEWLAAYSGRNSQKSPDSELFAWNDWLQTDSETDFATLRTLLSPEACLELAQGALAVHKTETNMQAAQLVLDENQELISWLRHLPLYSETERQIFVHAGVDEAAGDLWTVGTPENMFTEKYPAEMGSFYKDIIAGHIGTASICGNPDYHRVFWDGQSHYYIDGSTADSGCLPILKYDTESGRYTEIIGEVEREIRS